jgi:hypothetical protein
MDPDAYSIDGLLSVLNRPRSRLALFVAQSQNVANLGRNISAFSNFSAFLLIDYLFFAKIATNGPEQCSARNRPFLCETVLRGFICLSFRMPSIVDYCASKRPAPSFSTECWQLIHFPLLCILGTADRNYLVTYLLNY